MTELSLEIAGMTCGHCVKAVQSALDAVPGVEVEAVAIGSARVRFDERQASRSRITQAVVDEGYAVTASH